MLSIQRLRMRLPQGYAARGTSISRHLAEVLGGAGNLGERRIDRLRLEPVEIRPHSSDRQIAESIAHCILDAIRRGE